jgi:hypothetical protein
MVTEVRTLGDAFRVHRRLVILGAPGSGKSTLGRWLALQFARGVIHQLDSGSPASVTVAAAQVDPDATDPTAVVHLGPARLPIFLRIAHFARELAECDRQRRPAQALDEYLGRDPDSCGLQDGCSPESRNALFRSFLDSQQAVVILDGLDELSETNRRSVVLKIHDFLDKYTTRKSPSAGEDEPWQAGGNQVVVTSRYVGYKLAPVRAGSAHFGIQAMKRPAVERFAHAWTAAVNAELALEGQAGISAEALVAEIYNAARPAVSELATNPLLVTILATVYWADRRLPDQRAGLYDRVVENLLRIWLQREECRAHGLTREELLAALEPLAAEMHENASSNGLIGLDRIGELVEKPLAHLRGMSPEDRRFRPVREALLGTIRKHVGLLAEQSPGNYAFFHRTFQEFLAARHLLTHRETAAAKIIDRLDDPLWREPLLLALGFAMIDPQWGPSMRAGLLRDVLTADGPEEAIPRATLLVTAALPDLGEVSPAVVGQVTARLLAAWTVGEQEQAALREQIEQAFGRLKAGRHANTVARQLAEVIRRPDANAGKTAAAEAEVLRELAWFTTDLVDALLVAVPRDRGEYDCPINRALLAALHLLSVPPPALDMTRLAHRLPMRYFLEANPALVEYVRGDTDWLWLMIALYGGLPDRPLSPPARTPFAPSAIVRDLADAELSRRIQGHLSVRKPAAGLKDFLERRWERAVDPAACAEALVGLAAIGEDVTLHLREALTHPKLQPAAQAAIDRFGWLRVLVQRPLAQLGAEALGSVPREAGHAHRLDLFWMTLEVLVGSGCGPLEVYDEVSQWIAALASNETIPLDEGFWSFLANAASVLDSGIGSVDAQIEQLNQEKEAAVAEQDFEKAAALRDQADKLKKLKESVGEKTWWPKVLLPPRADTARNRYLALLDVLAGVPLAFALFGKGLLARFKRFVEEQTDLLYETIALGRTRRGSLAGYLQAEWRDRGSLMGYLEEGPNQGERFWALLNTFRKRAAHIADPYVRFRALWRFASDSRRASLALIESIQDPHDQVRAVEWVLLAEPADFHRWWDLVARAAARIDDPENRARALARLAFFASEHLESLLNGAVAAVAEIADPARRAETIRELRTAWGRTAGIQTALAEVAQKIPDPWQRDKALGRFSRLVQVYRGGYPNGSLPWGLVHLSSTAAEMETLASTGTGGEWVRLLGAERKAAVAALETAGMENGLRITAREVSVLDRIVQAGDAADLDRLWPLLEQPEVAAFTTILRWSGRGDGAGQWAALVQAEAGWLTPETVAGVLDLLATATDRLRCRAAIALHGWNPSTTNEARRWSVERVGAEVVELIAQRAIEDCSEAMASALYWVQHDLHHDSSEALNRWLTAGGGAEHDESALWILGGMESVSPSLIPVLLNALESGPAHLQSALLWSLARLASCRRASLDLFGRAIAQAVAAVSPEVRAAVNALPAGSVTLLSIAQQVAGIGGGTSVQLREARRHLVERTCWLDESSLSTEKAVLDQLAVIGSERYVSVGSYWAETDKAAAPLAENPGVLEVLLAWLAADHAGNLSMRVTADLLVATESLARLSPDAFAARADPHLWEPILTERARYSTSWTARQAAILLLGRLRRVTERVALALRAAMNDILYVQQAAYTAVGEFRRLSGDVIEDLLPALDDPSAGVAAATARLLAGVAKAEGTLAADRRRILRGLQRAAGLPGATRPVYLLEEPSNAMHIRFVDRLDRILYRAIFEITGL